MMTFSPDPRKYESAQEAVAAFEAKGINPEGYTLYTYAAIQAWQAAVESAGTTDFEPVVAALDDMTFDTVLGGIDFNEVGDPTEANYVWYVWEDGTYREM